MIYLRALCLAIILTFLGCRTGSEKLADVAEKENNRQAGNHVVFADFINRFEDTDEMYVPLYFSVNDGTDVYTILTKAADSVITETEEMKRTRIPFRIASRYLDLSDLEHIDIYDINHNFKGEGRLKRIEYFEDLIEAFFVAVYTTNKPIESYFYCLTHDSPVISGHNVDEPPLNEELLTEIQSMIGIENSDSMRVFLFEVLPDQKRLTFVSVDTMSYLIKSPGKMLYRSTTAESIEKVIILPVKKNDHPLLLVWFSRPDTDMFWSALLEFNGNNYQVTTGNRVSLENGS